MNNYRLLMVLLFVLLCSIEEISEANDNVVLGVEEMFRLADENSKKLQPFKRGIEESEAGIQLANANKLPDINLSLSFSYLGDGFTTARDFGDYQTAPIPHFGNNFSLEAKQVVYSGGAISGGVEIAELKREMASSQYESAQNSVRFMVIGNYLDLYKYRNLRIVYANHIEQTKKVIKEMEAKEREGVVLKNDITRYELLLSNLELTLTQIENGISILNRNLTSTLGLPEKTDIIPDDKILTETIPSRDAGYWQESATLHSPTLRSATIGIQMSKTEEKIVSSERLPHIALIAGYQMDGPITIEVPPINRNFNYWYVGVGISYNLSSLYKNNKARNRSKIATYQAEEEYASLREEISLAINADYTKYIEAYAELERQNKNVELANENYRVIYNRYTNDIALLTDMLDATNAKLQAEQELVNAQINIIYYYYKLQYISGLL